MSKSEILFVSLKTAAQFHEQVF